MTKRKEIRIRKLIKTGRGKSFCLTLPISFIRKLKWREHQKLVVVLDKRGKKIIIKDWKPK